MKFTPAQRFALIEDGQAAPEEIAWPFERDICTADAFSTHESPGVAAAYCAWCFGVHVLPLPAALPYVVLAPCCADRPPGEMRWLRLERATLAGVLALLEAVR